MIFNSLFGLLFEGYFVMVLCCFFNLSAPEGDVDRNFQNFALGFILMVLLLVILPFILIFIAFQPKKTLEDQSFKDMFGKAYQDLRIRSNESLLYRVFFCLRRAIFVFSIYQMYEYPA